MTHRRFVTFLPTFQRRMMASDSGKPIYFGPFEVTSQVFHTTPHSFALVNLKPLLPGHVLVSPLRRVPRLTDLSPSEVTDLFLTVQKVQHMLALRYFSSSNPSDPESSQALKNGSFNIAIQDGLEAGQSVAHVHCHIIPRLPSGANQGDAIYERLAGEEGNVGGMLWDREIGKRPEPGGKFPKIEDSERKPRSMEEMEREAEVFREGMRRLGGERETGGKED